MVGSIIPSSRLLIERMLRPVDWDENQAVRRIWTGSRHLHPPTCSSGCRPDAKLVTIDTNSDFTKYLTKSIDDPRLVAVTGSAADVEQILTERGFGKADYVLSGLPFSTLPPGVGDAIAKATAKVVRPGGAFLVYQFSPKVLDFIKPHFEQDRSRLRVDQRPAGDLVLGMARRLRGLRSG